jgi:diadenosine tetraphosphate (Ap4A) HIT family hydrolase
MIAMRRLPLILTLLAAIPAVAEINGGCVCDLTRPETLEAVQCGLCRLAETHPAAPSVFLIKDNSPRKPNRWLALPRLHQPDFHELSSMTAGERLEIWTVAIEKAKSLWGDDWGVALNGLRNRTQCHAHIHIGKLLKAAENRKFIVISSPAQIPVPPDGEGLWIHPAGGKLHVHTGESATETVLLR